MTNQSKIRFSALGSIEIAVDGLVIAAPTMTVASALFVALLFEAGHILPSYRLAHMVWDSPPVSAAANLRNHASRLRRFLDSASVGLGARLRTQRGGGYGLLADPHHIDVHTFRTLVRLGRAHQRLGEHVKAAEAFSAALDMWRGSAGEGLPVVGQELAALIDGLNQQRLTVIEDLAVSRLALGEATCVAEDLGPFCNSNPLRERAWALLIQARYAAGDPAGALAAVATARESLGGHLGIELGPALRRLHLNVLRREVPESPH
jgi:DNA-binding SARP family transcriptional activator